MRSDADFIQDTATKRVSLPDQNIITQKSAATVNTQDNISRMDHMSEDSGTPAPAIAPAAPLRRNLLKGNAAVLSARAAKKAKHDERAAKQLAQVRERVEAELADLPLEMRQNSLIRQCLENKANAQVILEDQFARLRLGENVTERTLEASIKLLNVVQSASNDFLSRWPKEDKAVVTTRKIPRSVIDWLSSLEADPTPIEILEPAKK